MLVDIVQVCHIIELSSILKAGSPSPPHRYKISEEFCSPPADTRLHRHFISVWKSFAAVQLRVRLHADFAPAGIAAQKIHKTIHQKTRSDRQKQYHKHDAPSDILSES